MSAAEDTSDFLVWFEGGGEGAGLRKERSAEGEEGWWEQSGAGEERNQGGFEGGGHFRPVVGAKLRCWFCLWLSLWAWCELTTGVRLL